MTLDKEIMEVLSEDIYTTKQRLNEQGVLDAIKVKTGVSAGRAVNAFIKLASDA